MVIDTAALLALIPWRGIFEKVLVEASKEGARSLLKRLSATEQEAAIKRTIELFVEEFERELRETVSLTAAIPGYLDQLGSLVETASPLLVDMLQPEVCKVNLAVVERQWAGDPLPEDFSWGHIALNFERALKKLVREDHELRSQLETAVAERSAGPAPGFDLAGYREYIKGKCNHLHLSAMHSKSYHLRINLWSVFVPPSARESMAVRELPLSLRQRLRQEGHLEHFGDGDRNDADEFAKLQERWKSGAVTPILDLLGRERLLVILGDPGSGKTSVLKYSALQWALGSEAQAELLPLWIDLKEFASSGLEVLQYLHGALGQFRLDFREIESRLEGGKARLYFDGLDEVFSPIERRRAIEEISALSARYRSSSIVVSSRIVGYEADRFREVGFFHATLEDFNSNQLESFLQKWHLVAELDAQERAGVHRRLTTAVEESDAIRALAGNPLLLTMMALLNLSQELPRHRVELYREASRVLLQEWETRKALPVDNFGLHEKQTLLRRIAGEMQQGTYELAGNVIDRAPLQGLFRSYLGELGIGEAYDRSQVLIRQLEERNFILCYGGVDRFSFVHRTFLEYFCACWFVDKFQVQQTLTIEQLKNEVFARHWNDQTWHEVLRLIVGMLSESHADQLIRYLMELDGNEWEFANLVLAAGCLCEVRNRKPLSGTEADLKKLLMDDVVRFERLYYYEEEETKEEVGSVRLSGVRWTSRLLSHSEALDWLKSIANEDSDPIVRASAIRELRHVWKPDEEKRNWLKSLVSRDEGVAVCWPAITQLATEWEADRDVLTWMDEITRTTKHPDLRATLIISKSKGGAQGGQPLDRWAEIASSDPDDIVRVAYVMFLAHLGKEDPRTFSMLQELERNETVDSIRMLISREMILGWSSLPEILSQVADSFTDPNVPFDKVVLAEALARNFAESAQTLPLLREYAQKAQSAFLRQTIIKELVRGWKSDPATFLILLEIAQLDENAEVRRTAIDELSRGWAPNERTFSTFMEQATSDQAASVRETALVALVRGWASEAATFVLLNEKALRDVDAGVRSVAIVELARGWKSAPGTLELISEGPLADEAPTVRRVAIQELARWWRSDPRTAVIIKEAAASDSDAEVRIASLRSLSRGWKSDPETLIQLVKSARDAQQWEVRAAAVKELVRGWRTDVKTLPLLEACIRTGGEIKRVSERQELSALLSKYWPARVSALDFEPAQ